MRSFLYGVIVPSLWFMAGCTRHDAASSHSQITQEPQTVFALHDVDGRHTVLTLQNGQLHLDRVVQPYIVLHFFSTRTHLCRTMLPYLSHLQHTLSHHIFLVGIVVPESIGTPALKTYMRTNQATFFISNAADNGPLVNAIVSMLSLGSDYPLPLTVVFGHGRYVTHYAGNTPIEMIRNDLKSLQKNGD